MINLVDAEVRQQIDQRLSAQGWTLDPQSPTGTFSLSVR